MTQVTLRADCARCAALCCVAFAFDRSEQFAVDKAAGEVCLHLTTCAACGIHAERARRGFSGCVRYDCLGAGQRVVQELFGGASWQDQPDLLQPMLRAFAVVRRAHEVLVLLEAAKRLPLARAERWELERLERSVQAMALQARTAPWNEGLTLRVQRFLQSLRRHVKRA